MVTDPIEFLAGDFNFYRYVGGDPVNFVDPSGLFSEVIEIPVAIVYSLIELGTLAIESQLGRYLFGQAVKAAVGTLSNDDFKNETEADKKERAKLEAEATALGLNVIGKQLTLECLRQRIKKTKTCGRPAITVKGKKTNSPAEIKRKLEKDKDGKNLKAYKKAKDLICSEIKRKEQDIDDCIVERKKVTDICHGGDTDASHANEEEVLDTKARAALEFIKKALGCP